MSFSVRLRHDRLQKRAGHAALDVVLDDDDVGQGRISEVT